MGFKRFSLLIIMRTIAAMFSLLLLAYFLAQPGYHAASTLTAIVLTLQLIELIRFVSRTNAELVRFFDAARHADYSQRFDLSRLGSGFDELGLAFGDILKRLQSARTQQEESLRHVKAVVEHVPVPLLSIQSSGKITLWNNSARRLFGTHHVVNIDDMKSFNKNFPKLLSSLTPGERALATIKIDGMQHQLSISATEIIIAKRKESLVSLQDIQSELDAAQLEAWQDLVRVLTHEIMNSVTPVASLAKTAADLVDDIKPKFTTQPDISETLDDVGDAVKTVARRSDGLMQFVSSYRQLTRLPAPNKKQVRVTDLFNDVASLVSQQWQDKNVAFTSDVSPSGLTVSLDPEMITQVLLNLLLNAEHATKAQENATIALHSFINSRGHVIIEVSDNGQGISEDLAEKVFVPFFTTKREGSGVGLALTRQIMLAHNGYVSLTSKVNQGSKFTLTF